MHGIFDIRQNSLDWPQGKCLFSTLPQFFVFEQRVIVLAGYAWLPAWSNCSNCSALIKPLDLEHALRKTGIKCVASTHKAIHKVRKKQKTDLGKVAPSQRCIVCSMDSPPNPRFSFNKEVPSESPSQALQALNDLLAATFLHTPRAAFPGGLHRSQLALHRIFPALAKSIGERPSSTKQSELKETNIEVEHGRNTHKKHTKLEMIHGSKQTLFGSKHRVKNNIHQGKQYAGKIFPSKTACVRTWGSAPDLGKFRGSGSKPNGYLFGEGHRYGLVCFEGFWASLQSLHYRGFDPQCRLYEKYCEHVYIHSLHNVTV